MDWSSGTVAIGTFPLDVQNVDNFEVDAAPFLFEVEQKFKKITPDLQKIFSKLL